MESISALLAIGTGVLTVFKLYVDLLGAPARRKRSIAEVKNRIRVTKYWYAARVQTQTFKPHDAERIEAELSYAFGEFERTRLRRGRGDVNWFRRGLLFYELGTAGGRFFRSWALGYSLLMPVGLGIRAYVLWRSPSQPLIKDWTVILPPHFFSGPWNYWLTLVLLIVFGNLAEMYPEKAAFSKKGRKTSS